jgi:hypothetical protein
MKTKSIEEFMNDSVIPAALEAGFMISTQYGQEESKLMPRSDNSTLREFARLISTALLAHLEEKVDDMIAAHIRWSNTELSEYARGGREACEDFKALLHIPSREEECEHEKSLKDCMTCLTAPDESETSNW